jgi:integration host factor subunit alpha
MPRARTQYNQSLQKTLTRAGLARAVYERIEGLHWREARHLVDSVFDEIVASLAAGEIVKLHEFGVFVLREKRPVSTNPRTGAQIRVKPGNVVSFKPSTNLKAVVNRNLQALRNTQLPATPNHAGLPKSRRRSEKPR